MEEHPRKRRRHHNFGISNDVPASEDPITSDDEIWKNVAFLILDSPQSLILNNADVGEGNILGQVP